MINELYHHGVLGQHWGIRRYQNPDGSLTEEGRARLEKKDAKWAKKNYNKIYSKAFKKSSNEMKRYTNQINRDRSNFTSNGQLKASVISDYNKRLGELMTRSVSKIRSPSGKSVQFIAKRGSMGVHLALADPTYNAAKDFKNGIWEGGRIAYKKDSVNVV